MPYIKSEKRPVLDGLITTLSEHCTSVGDVNYIITKFLHQQLEEVGLDYTNINAVIGVLECAKLELYRMVAAKYEDKKRTDNGHISSLDESIV